MTSVEVEARTVDEAIEKTLAVHEVPDERLQIELPADASRGVVGLGTQRALSGASALAEAGVSRETPFAIAARALQLLEVGLDHLVDAPHVEERIEPGLIRALESLLNWIVGPEETGPEPTRIELEVEGHRVRRAEALGTSPGRLPARQRDRSSRRPEPDEPPRAPAGTPGTKGGARRGQRERGRIQAHRDQAGAVQLMTPAEEAELLVDAARLGIVLEPQAVVRLGRFIGLLEIWNRRFRLTGDRDRKTLLRKHVVDSLAVLPGLSVEGPILDIGTGAGFPGIVLACVRPEREILLLEPRRRPSSFLVEVIRTVGLGRARGVEARAEDAARDEALRGSMATVVSRALKLEKLFALSRPFLRRPDGIMVAMQSQALCIEEARRLGVSAGMELRRSLDYRLPGGEARRLLVFASSPQGA